MAFRLMFLGKGFVVDLRGHRGKRQTCSLSDKRHHPQKAQFFPCGEASGETELSSSFGRQALTVA